MRLHMFDECVLLERGHIHPKNAIQAFRQVLLACLRWLMHFVDQLLKFVLTRHMRFILLALPNSFWLFDKWALVQTPKLNLSFLESFDDTGKHLHVVLLDSVDDVLAKCKTVPVRQIDLVEFVVDCQDQQVCLQPPDLWTYQDVFLFRDYHWVNQLASHQHF